MPHLPFFQFYPADWIQDTQILSQQAKGCWIDVLCQLWVSPVPGKRTWNIHSFTTLLRLEYDEDIELIVADLGRVADVRLENSNGEAVDSPLQATFITITSRRMVRDWAKLQKEKNKYKRYNRKRTTKQPPDNHQKTTAINQKSEVRSQISEEDINTSSVELENSSSHGDGAIKAFPYEFLWIKELVEMQTGSFPKERFMDFAWWEAVSFTCGGLSQAFLEREFAGIRRWVMDNPQRAPTPRGYRRFVAGWLERAHDKERRFPNGNQTTRRR